MVQSMQNNYLMNIWWGKMTDTIRLHFLDVGDGDCTLIQFPNGRIGLIDIHTNHEFGMETINYLKKIIGDKHIFRFILTHPHQDHLHGIKDLVDGGIYIENFWHINHSYTPDIPNDGEENYDERKKQWDSYKPHWDTYEQRDNKLIFTKERQDRDFLTEDNIEILSPSAYLDKKADELGEDTDAVHRNNYVIKITNNKFSVLLCGDADNPALNHLIEEDSDRIKNCTLLKAPHHGTESHWNEDFVDLCSPKFVVLHQGEERAKDSAEDKYEHDQNCEVGITKKHGVIVIDGKSDGSCVVVTNGNYQKVLNDLGK